MVHRRGVVGCDGVRGRSDAIRMEDPYTATLA